MKGSEKTQVSVAVLAGGKSSRMGTDKALLEVLGQPLIERVLARVEGLADEVIVITNQPADFVYLDIPLFADIVPNKGSLGGIYTAISRATGEHTLVVAVDMPFLQPGLLAFLLSLREGYDVVAPRLEGYPQAMLKLLYGELVLPIGSQD